MSRLQIGCNLDTIQPDCLNCNEIAANCVWIVDWGRFARGLVDCFKIRIDCVSIVDCRQLRQIALMPPKLFLFHLGLRLIVPDHNQTNWGLTIANLASSFQVNWTNNDENKARIRKGWPCELRPCEFCLWNKWNGTKGGSKVVVIGCSKVSSNEINYLDQFTVICGITAIWMTFNWFVKAVQALQQRLMN